MNANELIEELEDAGSFFEDALYLKSAALLRQQQAEIEALKAEVQNWVEWKESLNGWSKK